MPEVRRSIRSPIEATGANLRQDMAHGRGVRSYRREAGIPMAGSGRARAGAGHPVQEKRDTDAAERFFRRLRKEVNELPERIITDKLGSYSAAKARMLELHGVEHLQVHSSARLNNRAEQSHQPTRQRERRIQGFSSIDSAQRFLSTFSRVCNHFRLRRHLLSASQFRHRLQERFVVWREVVQTIALN